MSRGYKTTGSCKYHVNFKNIMSLLGKGRNEIAAVHLVKCYCLPVLTCACEIWRLSSAEYHNIDVIWNNSFRRIYSAVVDAKAQLAYNFIVVAFQ